VPSSRALGIFALCAVILAAISFAAVDVTIASGCEGAIRACSDTALPAVAIICAIIGSAALLASVVPALAWLVGAIHHSAHHDPAADVATARLAVLRPAYDEEEL